MNNIADILSGRVVDVYDGDTALASTLVASGAEQAYAISGPVLEDVKKIIGLPPS